MPPVEMAPLVLRVVLRLVFLVLQLGLLPRLQGLEAQLETQRLVANVASDPQWKRTGTPRIGTDSSISVATEC